MAKGTTSIEDAAFLRSVVDGRRNKAIKTIQEATEALGRFKDMIEAYRSKPREVDVEDDPGGELSLAVCELLDCAKAVGIGA